MSIRVSQVTKLYGEQKALNDVSFEVKRGEIVGFLGPNGAGKSTMMKIITGFIPPSEGDVSVTELDVIEHPIETKKKIGYLPEHNPLYTDMYVREYLYFIAGLHKIKNPKQIVEDIIVKVGLGVEQNKKIEALSKGYRQRVGLAQALIHDPQVLILDEPTTGLDPNQLGEIRQLIKDLGKDKTVMLSTHIMQEVEAICDRVIIINKGEIVANDKTENIKNLAKQSNFYLVEFDQPADVRKLKNITGVKAVEKISDTQFRIESRGKADIRNQIFDYAVNNKLIVLTLQKEDLKLEDIFKEVTK